MKKCISPPLPPIPVSQDWKEREYYLLLHQQQQHTYRLQSMWKTEGKVMGQVDDRHAALGVVRVLSCAELEQQLVHIVHYICATVKDNSTGLYAYIYRTLCINEQKYQHGN